MLIEKEALLSKFDPDGRDLNPIEVRALIVQAPAVDAVPVVRCVNCKNHGNCDIEDIMREICRKSYSDLFCPDGERKDGASDA
ncbi:MAG TPA: hypothetical protein VHP31_12175 [Caproicibacter sp.]|nr:hypothetical protein [Caproicibacter sp.]